jgi:rare lipoprotein A
MSSKTVVALLALFSPLATLSAATPGDTQRGVASWYGYECSSTASGERYNPMSMTAAHRTLPFGTMVRVTNLSSNRSAVVRINNRGPYRKGRIIDVSKAAAQELRMMTSGIAHVKVEVVAKSEKAQRIASAE